MSPTPVLSVTDLRKTYPIRRGVFRRTVGHVTAVDGVSFRLAPGETLAIVGESGSGKSTLGRLILRLTPPDAGQVLVGGTDFLGLDGAALKAARRHLQVIFQDPYASLNPRMTVREILREPLRTHGLGTAAEQEERVRALAAQVGLRPEALDRYPHEFSGGQRQRVGIARALALNPKVIIADEPVSALDVSVQSQVLNLIKDLQDALGLSFLFISHDLAVVQHISHRVAVLFKGRVVEEAPTAALFASPAHPYTQALLAAVPRPGRPRGAQASPLAAAPAGNPSACPYASRCPHARPDCQTTVPERKALGKTGQHFVACHLY